MPKRVRPEEKEDIFFQLIRGYYNTSPKPTPSDSALSIFNSDESSKEFKERIKKEQPQIFFDEIAKKIPGQHNKKFRKILRAVIVLCYVDSKPDLSLKEFLKLVAKANIAIDKFERKDDKQLEDVVFDFFAFKKSPNARFLVDAINQTKRKISPETFFRYDELSAFQSVSFAESSFADRLTVFANTKLQLSDTRGPTIFSKLFYRDQPYRYSADEFFQLLTTPNTRNSSVNYKTVFDDAIRRDLVKDFTLAQILEIASNRETIGLEDPKVIFEQQRAILENFIQRNEHYTVDDVVEIIKTLHRSFDFKIDGTESWIKALPQACHLDGENIKKLLAAFPSRNSGSSNKGQFFLLLSENKLDISLEEMLNFLADLGANSQQDNKQTIANFITKNPRYFDKENFPEIKRVLRDNFPQNFWRGYKLTVANEVQKKFLEARDDLLSREDLESLREFRDDLLSREDLESLREFSSELALPPISPRILARLVGEVEPEADRFSWALPVIKGKSIDKFVDPSKLVGVMEEFGITEQYSMQRFFNLCLLRHGGLLKLKTVLSEPAIKQFWDAYIPSKDSIIWEEERGLNNFLPHFALQAKTIDCGDLCNFFDTLLSAKVKEFSEEECRNFELPNPEVAEAIFGSRLKKLIENPNPSKKEVKDFFAAVLGSGNLRYDRGVNLSLSIDDYMHRFWKKEKDKILTLLQTSDGFATFLACCNTVSHGCSANIGTQLTIALYSALLEPEKESADENHDSKINPDAWVLKVLIEEVVQPKLTTAEAAAADIISLQSNPLRLSAITRLKLSPAAFIEKLEKNFENNTALASAFVGNILDVDQQERFAEIAEKFDNNPELYHKAAAYCVLKASSAAAILKAPSLMDFGLGAQNEEMQEILDEALAPNKAIAAPNCYPLAVNLIQQL